MEMDFGSSKAEALSLLGDLEALAFPLHDVVVTDDALMNKAADAVQIFGGARRFGFHEAGRRRGLGRPRLACARAASPCSRKRFLRRLT
jgi:hypothetical protein